MKKNKGFTLIEIGIVLFVVGVLIAVFMPAFTSGIKDSGKSTSIYSASQKVITSWTNIAKECSVATAITSNPLPLAGKTVLDVIGDSNNANLSYKACIQSSNSKDLGELVGPATGHKIEGYTVSLVDAPNSYVAGKLCVVLNAVPDAIIQPIVKDHGSGVATLAGSDATNANIQYGTATGGSRDLTICSQV